MNYPGEPSQPISEATAARIRELQAIIDDLQRRADRAEDEDVREGFHLQVSKLGLKIARLRRGDPEDLPSEVSPPDEAHAESVPRPTEAQIEQADQLIRRAKLEKQRGHKQAASELLKEAAEAAPGAASVLVELGDDLIERMNYPAALEAYRAAHRADPNNAAIERKYASLAMRASGKFSVDEQLRLALSDRPYLAPGEATASPKWAVFLSCIIPGSGQVVLGQTFKGIVIFSLWALSAAAFFLINHLLRNQPRTVAPWAYFPLALAVVAWLAGVADCSSYAKAVEKRSVSRPEPPVNLPYE